MAIGFDPGSLPNVLSDGNNAGVDTQHLEQLDRILHDIWGLGRNLILVWAPADHGIDVLVIPHYLLSEIGAGRETRYAGETMGDILSGAKQRERRAFEALCHGLDRAAHRVELDFQAGEDVPYSLIETLIERYGISFAESRAVALFDIVGFSLLSPLDQVTQLNSLAHSLNSAHSKMLSRNIAIKFARSTTGDGFYIWNRDVGVQANINLYHFMHLVLADSAIAKSKAASNTTPHLRTCFHVGSHYEFHQSEGLNPTMYSYIVGDVTIALSRMIDCAIPGQILVGDFMAPMPDWDQGVVVEINTPQFIHKTQETLSGLEGVVMSGDAINNIKCYLTGDRLDDNNFAVSRFLITDKHGLTRNAFNAKVNIYRQDADPIFLGRRTADLGGFEYADMSHVSPVGSHLDQVKAFSR